MRILLGLGGGEDSFRALSRTIERVRGTGDELAVAIVENPATEIVPDEIERRVRAKLEAGGIEASVRRVTGHPGSRLVEIAETEGFDALAIGGGEESPMGKITLGSVTEFVVLNAGVTVILVR